MVSVLPTFQGILGRVEGSLIKAADVCFVSLEYDLGLGEMV